MRLAPRLSSLMLPWPCDWDALFADDAPAGGPLILEIGFGYGHFLKHLSAQNPQARIVGVEIANECLVHVEKMRDRGDLPNVRAVFSRAETALYHLFAPASLDQIHVNFPDPWFKARHERRRLMTPSNLAVMTSRLKPGGRLYLATDIHDYALMSDEALRGTAGLVNTLPAPWSDDPLPGRIITKYERKAIAEGRARHYFAYRRDDTPLPDLPVITEAPMPHITLALPLTAPEIASAFTSFSAKAAAREPRGMAGQISVNASEAFTGRGAVLVECYVSEPTIHQHVAVMIVPIKERPGEWAVGLGTLGSPRPTDGIHFAVRKVAEWAVSLHSDARITGDKARTGFESLTPDAQSE
ncbi:MAG: tRNA (guanosine(46)-N7)-methyltransferase TrmB [Chloroflexi bacterium]|nr:tRNA (guanosine(46)-N7)-methyltransferase TrmB [Chloroflexota bacterium]